MDDGDLSAELSRYSSMNDPSVCDNCYENGHMSYRCWRIRKITCILCASVGHTMRNCPSAICTHCKQTGHNSFYCKGNPRKTPCFSCELPGHSAQHCISRPDIVRNNYLGLLTCINCREKGHLNCNEPATNIHCFCFKCGMKGHSHANCPAGHKPSTTKDLFRKHVKLTMEYIQNETDRDLRMGKREKKYWNKVENKAFKKLLKRAKYNAHRRTSKSPKSK